MRRVLISGGSRGIGRACVEAFCAQGDAVVFFYRRDHAAAQAVALATGAHALCIDVSDSRAVNEGVRQARELLGGFDVLVNNAGVAHMGLFTDMSDEEYRRVMDTNLSAAFYLSRAVAPDMIRQGKGSILYIGSVWGRTGASCEVAYSASKAGLRGLTLAQAKELGPSGVTVNCIEPGVIETDMNVVLDDGTRHELCDATPLGRMGHPEEVANAVLFLASEQASFITGQLLGVDGGFAL